MKKLLIFFIFVGSTLYAARSLTDASKRFQTALAAYVQAKNPATAQAVINEYDSPENTDKYRRTFDSTLQTKGTSIAQIRAQAKTAAPVETVTAYVKNTQAAQTTAQHAPHTSTGRKAALTSVAMPTPKQAVAEVTEQETLAQGYLTDQELEQLKSKQEARQRAKTKVKEKISQQEGDEWIAAIDALKKASDDQFNHDAPIIKENIARSDLSDLNPITQRKLKAFLHYKRPKSSTRASAPATSDDGPDIRDLMEQYRQEQAMRKAEAENAAVIAAQKSINPAVEQHLKGVLPVTGYH